MSHHLRRPMLATALVLGFLLAGLVVPASGAAAPGKVPSAVAPVPALSAGRLRPAVNRASGSQGQMYFDGCHGSWSSTRPRLCRYHRAGRGRPKVLLLGDSHAAHWYSGVRLAAKKRGWNFFAMTKTDCSVTNAVVNLPFRSPDPYWSCVKWRKRARAMIKKKNFDLIIASDWDHRYVVGRGGRIVGAAERDERWIRGAGNSGRFLTKHSGGVVWIRAVPDLDKDVLGCIRRHWNRPNRCSVSRYRATYRDLWPEEKSALRGISGLKLVDPIPRMCPRGRCRMNRGRTLIWRNRNHITQRYARQQWRVLSRAADKAWASA